ncbi:fatty acid hydroxylase [Desarmillaria tabescens]|uniref:Fatty acid hydroxylase n=1 Tax=Armillaria tabescens TaxID=1929756 RepID=A0AA39MXC5_ARMTA|nr:fatty acid hydroxylase [Desarmillaria tabescens]KAK0450436.1 fatty acid hydroxylase [Desarmillaria tabescens]
MDFVLSTADDLLLDKVWAHILPLYTNTTTFEQQQWELPLTFPPASSWPRDYIPRQIISLSVLTLIGIFALYFIFAWLSYRFIFNHDMMRHPKFLPNQVRLEIMTSVRAFPVMTLLTLPWFEAEVLGYSKLYDGLDTYGWPYLFASIPLFLLFTDYCIYWVHRWLHVPFIYKVLHKPHHKWIIPSPWSSHAFHPVDGYLQSVPYHLFTVINGPAHHTLHHIYFTVNYGQYFTWADRVGNSYRQPEKSLDPLLEVQLKGNKKEQ